MATVLLVRHGHSSANGAGVLAGRMPDVRLTDRGETDVRHMAVGLAPLELSRIVSSPLERCQQTAAALASGRGLEVQTDERLTECAYGAWTGRLIKELTDDPLWQTVQDTPSTAVFPASDEYAHEGIAEMASRAVDAIQAMDQQVEAEAGAGAVWAAVSHGDVIKAIVAHACATPLDEFQRIVVEPSAVAAIRVTRERIFLLGLNADVPRLARALALRTEQEATSTQATPGGSTGH